MKILPKHKLVAVGVFGALLVSSLTGCTSSQPDNSAESGDFSGQTLTVTAYAGSWGDSFTEAFVAPFENETGAKVKIVSGAPAEWLTKLKASKGSDAPFDLVLLTADAVPNAVASGIVKSLDTSKLENFPDLNEVLRGQSNIGGEQYGVPLTVGSTGLAYRTDKVDAEIRDWPDIFEPTLCGHVAVPPITFNAGVEFLAGLANSNGGDISNPDDLDAAFSELEKLADCASAFPADGGSVASALQNGDAYISPNWDGRAFVLQNAGEPIEFVYPSSGPVGALTSYFLTEGTSNEALATEFINFLTEAEHQKVFAEGTWYAASNETIEYSEEFNAQIKHGSEIYESFVWVDYEVITPQLTEMQDRWNRIFS